MEFATKRALKAVEKDTAAKLARLDRVAAAPDLTFISISVDRVRSRTWGQQSPRRSPDEYGNIQRNGKRLRVR